MKRIAKSQFIDLVTDNLGSDVGLKCDPHLGAQEVSLEEGYQAIRAATTELQQSANLPKDPVRFTSKPVEADLDMERVTYQ